MFSNPPTTVLRGHFTKSINAKEGVDGVRATLQGISGAYLYVTDLVMTVKEESQVEFSGMAARLVVAYSVPWKDNQAPGNISTLMSATKGPILAINDS